MRILLIEDNRDLALNICEYFESQHHVIDYASDGINGLNLAVNESFDAIIMDVMLPGMNGFQCCRQLRESAKNITPILLLTAKDTEEDKLLGFDAGADDYLVKPFSLRELEARLRALRNRTQNRVVSQKLKVGDLVYNPDTMVFKRAGRRLSIKPVPRKILIILMKYSFRVVTRQEIEREVWHDDPPDKEVLRAHIYSIRREIDQNNLSKLLHTIHGEGYRLAEIEP